MRINTDGVLLGALSVQENPQRVLDIGTGTGVVGLMIAQRYRQAAVCGIDIDQLAAARAKANFASSPFSERMSCLHGDILCWETELHFDLIVSNPPFYVDGLRSGDLRKDTAKHGDVQFFEGLMRFSSQHMSPYGKLQLIAPFGEISRLIDLAGNVGLLPREQIDVRSFADGPVIRSIVSFAKEPGLWKHSEVVIYDQPGEHSAWYKQILKPYFLAF